MTDEAPPDNSATPETLIARTARSLRDADGTDVELLDILSKHILTVRPAETAINKAVSAIEALAAKRAESSDNGALDHD